jgi:hypothetical protein
MPKPVLETVADQTFITGAVKWIRDKDVRAVILPPGTAPLEEYTFLTIRASDKKFIRIRVTTDGFVRIPTGDHSIYHLSLRYPTPRGGE